MKTVIRGAVVALTLLSLSACCLFPPHGGGGFGGGQGMQQQAPQGNPGQRGGHR